VFPQNLALWNLAEQLWWRFLTPPVPPVLTEDEIGRNYMIRRQNYLNAPMILEQLPDLTVALQVYERNLITIIETAQTQGIRLILATQPVIWHADLSPEAENLLWFGLNRTGRYTVDGLRQGMDVYNQRLLDVCQRYAVECIDLANTLSGHESYFYDDVHFNEAGARAVAEVMAAYLVSHQRQ
jgi:lysophospholipase L1-like esterase